MIRAKFRCMEVVLRWDKTRRVELLPVNNHVTEGQASDTENHDFWKATPSGKLNLTYTAEQDCQFVAGEYYYVDLEHHADGSWLLEPVEQRVTSLTVGFNAPWQGELLHQGHLEMSIDNEAAWPAFVGKVGSKWRVSFSWAEASDTP